MTHTRAPWSLDHRLFGWAVRGPYLGSLATVHNLVAEANTPLTSALEGDATAEEMVANARLICAAPDLLAALDKLLAANESVGTAGGHIALLDAMDQGREALVVARGAS